MAAWAHQAPGPEDESICNYHEVTSDWTRARLDIVNGLLRMAGEAQTALECMSVLRMASDARDAGLLSLEEAHHTALIADARMRCLSREGNDADTTGVID